MTAQSDILSCLSLTDRFLRSTDLVRDFDDPGALEGYWLTDFSRNAGFYGCTNAGLL